MSYRRNKKLKQAYDAVFRTEQGQWVLNDLAREHYILDTTATENDSHVTYFKEGQRAAVLRIMGILRMSLIEIQNIQEVAEN